jgi:isopentenyldiphosphate isomerase
MRIKEVRSFLNRYLRAIIILQRAYPQVKRQNYMSSVVHLHLLNSKGELFLQKRPEWKKIQPGRYDTAVGGHAGFGERIEEALKRETKEELGIENFNPKFLKKYTFESTVEKELIHIYTVTYDGEIHPGEELDGGGFWRLEEIMENMGKKVFTPNFESEFKTYIKQLF